MLAECHLRAICTTWMSLTTKTTTCPLTNAIRGDKETDRVDVREGGVQKDKILLNEKAERFAKALAEKSRDPLSNSKILEGLQFELERCVHQGADVDAIYNILANT